MSLGRQRERQADMLVSWAEMPRSPGHVFYDKLQAVLIAADFDAFVETQCAKEYAPRRGRPSLPPGRYFRMLLIGYFEGIDSERGLEWRCADSLSLREFLRLSEREGVPDHSWLSRTRSRLPLEVHDQVFTWVLERLAAHGLIKGERIEANTGPQHPLSTLHERRRRLPCKTCFRLAGCASTGRGLNPLDRFERFQVTSHSPFQDFACRKGGLRQTAFRRTGTSPRLSWAVYPPRCHLQQSLGVHGRRQGAVPLEGLPGWQPTEDHDLGCQ